MGLKEDIEEYMSEPYDDIVKDVDSAPDPAAYKRNLWNSIFPDGVAKELLWDYYRSAEYSNYLFWLAVQQDSQPGMPQLLANVIDMNVTQPRILDFGCGVGLTDIALRMMNFNSGNKEDVGFNNITLVDIPHRYSGFLRFINEKYELGFKFMPVEAWNEFPLEKNYDFIICDGLLEHVWDPVVTLTHLVDHLEAGMGLIYIASQFGDMDGHDPSHMKHNNEYQDSRKFLKMVEDAGLKPAYRDGTGGWKIFKKELKN